MPARCHVIGAGLAGLAAAVRLSAAGLPVSLYEAGMQAGGRCRSYFDKELGTRIDNGNHLLLAGNHDTMAYVAAIGASGSLSGPAEARIDFLDLGTGERWTLRPNRGRLPWWVLRPDRRVPGTRAADYLGVLRLARAGAEARVTDCLDRSSTLYRRLWQPFAVAALNTQPEEASARLLWATLRDSLGAGGAACRPLLPREGLSESLVDPALARLQEAGAAVQFGRRVRSLEHEGDRVTAIGFTDGALPLGAEDQVILAVPASVAAEILPGLPAPESFRGILNAHYRLRLPGREGSFLGLIGGVAEWIFIKPEVVSVTISAAETWLDRPPEALAELIWRDIAKAYDLPPDLPPHRIVKEKRATFAATPEQLVKRPPARTRWRNCFLAGDWTDTGLPATIEGAVRSGHSAAALARATVSGGGKA